MFSSRWAFRPRPQLNRFLGFLGVPKVLWVICSKHNFLLRFYWYLGCKSNFYYANPMFSRIVHTYGEFVKNRRSEFSNFLHLRNHHTGSCDVKHDCLGIQGCPDWLNNWTFQRLNFLIGSFLTGTLPVFALQSTVVHSC